jgi:hypothetical protein
MLRFTLEIKNEQGFLSILLFERGGIKGTSIYIPRGFRVENMGAGVLSSPAPSFMDPGV